MKSGRKEGGSGALARKLINGAKEKKGDPLSAREPIAMGISWILHGRRDRFTDLGGGGGAVSLLTLPFRHESFRKLSTRRRKISKY